MEEDPWAAPGEPVAEPQAARVPNGDETTPEPGLSATGHRSEECGPLNSKTLACCLVGIAMPLAFHPGINFFSSEPKFDANKCTLPATLRRDVARDGYRVYGYRACQYTMVGMR